MIKNIKDKILIFIPILLILYFVLNLLNGNRGLFSYFEKKSLLVKLEHKKKSLSQEIKELQKLNTLLRIFESEMPVPLIAKIITPKLVTKRAKNSLIVNGSPKIK